MDVVTDRNGLEVLDYTSCLTLLGSEHVGRVAYTHDGGVMVAPVNHVLLGSTVAFRTAIGGKLDAAIMRRPVAFEVDGIDETTKTGWSVVVRGVADVVDDEARLAWLEAQDLDSWADPRDAHWVQVRADDVSGRRVLRRSVRDWR